MLKKPTDAVGFFFAGAAFMLFRVYGISRKYWKWSTS